MNKSAQKRPTIGVLAGAQIYYGTLLGVFAGPLLQGVCAAAGDRRSNLLMACGMDSSYNSARPAWPVPSAEVDYVPVGPWNADGLIVINPLFSEARSRYLQKLIARGYPVIFATTGESGPTAAIDNSGGICQALTHLVSHGHRRIAFVAGYPNDMDGDSGVRLNAFRRFVRENGLAAEEELIAFGNHGINDGRQAMRRIIDSGVRFTAVLASNDESAIGAMTALKESGLRIPQDVAVIGVDDSPEAVTQSPPLTTLHSSPYRMGYQMAELLLDYIDGRREALSDLSVPMQLVIRQSCDCHPSATAQVTLEGLSRPLAKTQESLVASQVAQAMSKAVMAEARRSSADDVNVLCLKLVEACIQTLKDRDTTVFRAALEATVQRAEELDDEMYVWQAALSALENGLSLVLEMLDWPAADRFPEDLLKESWPTVVRAMQRQYRRSLIHQKWITDQAGQLNAKLLAALDEGQVYQILAGYLPKVGIRHIGVGFFEAEGEDPVAWSCLRKVSEANPASKPDGVEVRFPSRQFPPKELYEEPFRLVLLPMGGRRETPGYVAFDAANLDICANVVWQLVTFLRVVRLYREATEGRRLAEEADRLKSRFLSTVSHELRTPLHLITGLSGMLLEQQEHDDSGMSLRDLRRIHASAQHLDGLIQDVLDLARNEMGQLRLVCESLDLAQAFEVVAAAGEQLAEDKGLEWEAVLPGKLPRVWGDRTRLRQVVLNLINNAVKFTSKGKVALRVSAAGETVTISVSDTGLGILPQEHDVIFDEFRQSERTTARGYGGLGLGLALCKRLVEMHGGTIAVSSAGEEGGGSTFYFTLPVFEGLSADAAPAMRAPSQTVLLLADRRGNCEVLRSCLNRRGFEVRVLMIDESPGWPTRLLQARPGAVMLEQGSAAQTGWDVLKMLRENPLTREVPVLLYALNEAGDSGSVFEMDYLTKPMNKSELIGALERHGLRGRRGKTVLIVDDEPDALEMHARIVSLYSGDCRILKAGNGREALDLLGRSHPDLVLLDLMMPELDGFGVLEAMHADESLRDIPVLVITAQALSLEDMAKFSRGVTNVLSKGMFNLEETLALVAAALSRSRGLRDETLRIVRKAMAFLHDHYPEAISLEDAARHVGLSKEYLARCFHQQMGVTLVTYLNRYRIKQARRLLQEGGRSLTEVALETGFSSSTYFSRVFRQEMGISPRGYEQVCRQARI